MRMPGSASLLLWAWRVARIALGLTFLYAGVIKAGASEEFALALVPFTIIPESWTGVFAVGLSWAEIAAGILILLPRVNRAGAALILILAILFGSVLIWALANDIIVSCGCFGGDAPPSAGAMRMAIARDAVIAAAALFVVVFQPQRP